MIQKTSFIALILCLFLYSSAGFGQTVALDFDQDDCSGANHKLFEDLDNGKVVVITYIELGCSSCIVATSGINTLLPPFELSDPGRVKLLSFGYLDSYTCSQMLSWKNSNGYTHPVFSSGGAQTNYYGGMGMPTVVVLGGPDHTVLYKALGYATSDKPLISAAIAAGLALSAGIDDGLQEHGILVYPSLFDDHINLSFEKALQADVIVYDMLGKIVIQERNIDTERITLITTSLATGVYALKVSSHGNLIGSQRIIKQ